MTARSSTGTHRFLIIDMDGEIESLIGGLEAVLFDLAGWAEEHGDATFPAGLRRPAADAARDLRVSIGNASAHCLYRRGRHHAHQPMAIVAVPAATIATFASAVKELARTLLPNADQGVIDGLGEHAVTVDAREHLVEIAVRLHSVCTFEWGDDETAIAARLGYAATTVERVVLTRGEEARYNRVRNRIMQAWDGFITPEQGPTWPELAHSASTDRV
jgi:hypothetical protein